MAGSSVGVSHDDVTTWGGPHTAIGPWFAGKVVELGRRHGIPTPVNGLIYAALKPYVSGPPI